MASCDPAAYQRGRAYIVNTDVEDIYKKQWDSAVSLEDLPRFQEMALFLIDQAPSSERELCSAVILMRRQLKHAPKRSQLAHALRSLQAEGRITPQPELLRLCGPPGTLPARPALSRPLPSTPAAQQVWPARTHARTQAGQEGGQVDLRRARRDGAHLADAELWAGGGAHDAEVQLRVELLLLPERAQAAALVPARRALRAPRQPERLRRRAPGGPAPSPSPSARFTLSQVNPNPG